MQSSRGDSRYLKLLKHLHASTCPCSMTGDWRSCRPRSNTTSWSFSTATIRCARRSSSVSYPWTNGTKRWPLRRSPTRSWTGLSTTHIILTSRENQYGNRLRTCSNPATVVHSNTSVASLHRGGRFAPESVAGIVGMCN